MQVDLTALQSFFPPAERKLRSSPKYNCAIIIAIILILAVGVATVVVSSFSIGSASRVEPFNPSLYRSWHLDPSSFAYDDCKGRQCPKQLAPPIFTFQKPSDSVPSSAVGTLSFRAFGTLSIPRFYPTVHYCGAISETGGFADMDQLASETEYSYSRVRDKDGNYQGKVQFVIGSHVLFTYAVDFHFPSPTALEEQFQLLEQDSEIQSFSILSGSAKSDPNPIIMMRTVSKSDPSLVTEHANFLAQYPVESPEARIAALVRRLIFERENNGNYGLQRWIQLSFREICVEQFIPQDRESVRFLNMYEINPSPVQILTEALAAINGAFMLFTFVLYRCHKRLVPPDEYVPLDPYPRV